ncbi:hypothetical protein Tco_1220937 [Tanacetum coccineum]
MKLDNIQPTQQQLSNRQECRTQTLPCGRVKGRSMLGLSLCNKCTSFITIEPVHYNPHVAYENVGIKGINRMIARIEESKPWKPTEGPTSSIKAKIAKQNLRHITSPPRTIPYNLAPPEEVTPTVRTEANKNFKLTIYWYCLKVAFDLLRDALSAIFGLSKLKVNLAAMAYLRKLGVQNFRILFKFRRPHLEEDEDKDPEEEDPQEEEEDDMEVDIEEDENEPELTYPYKEVDPLNPPPPASDSKPEDVSEVENTGEPEDETVPASVYEVGESSTATIPREDGNSLLPGFMRRDIDSLFGRLANFSRRLCGRETAHALVEKKGKAKDKYYVKLILDLGNECVPIVEQGTAAMENLVRKLEMNESREVSYWARVRALSSSRVDIGALIFYVCRDIIMPPKYAPMTQDAIRRMIKEIVDAAIAAE